MSEKKHELYLIAFALVSAAVLILYIAFDSPPLNAVVVPPKSSTAQEEEQPDETESTHTMAGEGTAAGQTSAADGSSAQRTEKAGGLININTATKDQLMTLTGIGEVKAQAILDYRRENGNFYTVDELNKVTGIGDKTLEKIRANITV